MRDDVWRLLIPATVLGVLMLSRDTRPNSSVRARITQSLAEMGWPAAEVDHVIQLESGWRPSAYNPVSGAVGLIQFLPSTLGKIGFRPELPPRERAAAFRQLSALEQLPYIREFFRPMRWQRPGDTYLAVAASGHVGAPDERVIYPVGSTAWQQNPAWRSSPDGPITAGSIRALLLRRLS